MDIAGEEDALSSFDPYNTGVYRGVSITSSLAKATNEVSEILFLLFIYCLFGVVIIYLFICLFGVVGILN